MLMFTLVASALGFVLGGLFIGWIAMHLIGERPAKYVTSGVAIIAALTHLEFATAEATMGSFGLMLGLAILLFALLRTRNKTPGAGS